MKVFVVALVAMALCSPVAADQVFHKGEDRVQVFLGVMDLNDQTGELQNDNGNNDPVEIDFSELPTIGLEFETPYGSRDSGLEYGINAGGGISWKGDDTKFAGKAAAAPCSFASTIASLLSRPISVATSARIWVKPPMFIWVVALQ